MTEAAFTKQLLELAARFGWLASHHHDSRRQVRAGVFVGDKHAAGLPDLVLVRRGRVVFAELKVGRGKPSPLQAQWLEELRAVEANTQGVVEVHLWRPEDWDAIVAALR